MEGKVSFRPRGRFPTLSVNDRRLHFGVGTAERVDLEVNWPSGVRQKFPSLAVNRLVTIDEAAGVVKAEAFPPPRG